MLVVDLAFYLNMGGDMVRVDLASPEDTISNTIFCNIIYQGVLEKFIYACKGHDDQLFMEVVSLWNNGSCKMNGRSILFSIDSIAQVILMPNEGLHVRREGK